MIFSVLNSVIKTINLDSAREFFGLDFKIGVLDKLKSKK